MDRIFGSKNFVCEIVWAYGTASGGRTRGAKPVKGHDTILTYAKKRGKHTYNISYLPYSEKYIRERFTETDPDGRVYRTRKRGDEITKQYLDESKGVPLSDVWSDIKQLYGYHWIKRKKEELGYPTQKPLALLERIVEIGSNEGDIVLDPFCGCGTTVAAAEKLGRKWIGIDITVLAVNAIEGRIRAHYKDADFVVVGVPKDVPSARRLAADDKFEFEKWFVTVLEGQPYKSSGGGDTGIDGFLYAHDVEGGTQKIIISVKGGTYGPAAVRDLKGVVEREEAAAGLLLALNKPSNQSETEAASAGRFKLPGVERTYPKIQIFTVEDHFADKRPDIPDTSGTLKKAARVKREREKDQELPL